MVHYQYCFVEVSGHCLVNRQIRSKVLSNLPATPQSTKTAQDLHPPFFNGTAWIRQHSLTTERCLELRQSHSESGLHTARHRCLHTCGTSSQIGFYSVLTARYPNR